jgi:hypothetical protein
MARLVVTGLDGIAVFDAHHRRRRATDAMLYAFDLLELKGKDLRSLPLVERRTETWSRRELWSNHDVHSGRTTFASDGIDRILCVAPVEGRPLSPLCAVVDEQHHGPDQLDDRFPEADRNCLA